MQNRPPAPTESGLFMVVSALVGVAAIVWLFMADIIRLSCTALYCLWSWCDTGRFHALAAPKINLLAATANGADTVSISQWVDVMNQTAGILLLILVPLMLAGFIVTRQHPLNRTRRALNIHTLPHIMARFSPAIIPALCYGSKKDQLLNLDIPSHRSALSPEEFAARHRLVVNRRLDHDRARRVFLQQLGKPVTGPDAMAPHEKALFAVFGLQVFFNDRKAATALLDTLNVSCRFKTRGKRLARTKKGVPELDRPSVLAAFTRVAGSTKARRWLTTHPYPRTALAALHASDLRLPAGQFIWLKGLDRDLFYALSSSDRPKPYVEGAGIVTQSHWETLAAKHRGKLPAPVVDLAIQGLEQDLTALGLVIDNRPAAAPAGDAQAPDVPAPDSDEKQDDDDDNVADTSAAAGAQQTRPAASTATNAFQRKPRQSKKQSQEPHP